MTRASRRGPGPHPGLFALIGIGVTALVLSGCGGGGGGQEAAASAAASAGRFAGSEQTPQAAPDFGLHDQDGRLVRLSAQRGKFVLVTFLYTHCPDVCPLIAANLNEALRELGSARGSVRVLAVSVDPRGDRPAAVRRYVKTHRLLPEFRYLTGKSSVLESVWRAYNVGAVAQGPNLVDHVAYVLLIDRSGKTRLLYDAQVKAGDVVHDLRLLMGQS